MTKKARFGDDKTLKKSYNCNQLESIIMVSPKCINLSKALLVVFVESLANIFNEKYNTCSMLPHDSEE